MAIDRPRILLYGDFWEAAFENTWLTWLQDQGYPVVGFNHLQHVKRIARRPLAEKFLWRFGGGLLAARVSREFQRAADEFRPDLVLAVSGRLLTRQALEAIRSRDGATLFHYYSEDFLNPRNTTATLRAAAPSYDCFFTTKSYNVPELIAAGVRRAIYIPQAYCAPCHYPVQVSPAEAARYGSDVAFVGTWEADRAAVLEELDEFDLRVWGYQWERLPGHSRLRARVAGRAAYCREMSTVMNASKICLAFLRKANRDLHTSRTFEIPACGGFQLSERTDEILGFFDEGKEIECFASTPELKDKLRYYLAHDDERRRIARAGLERVRRDKHEHGERLRDILSYYQNGARLTEAAAPVEMSR